ncbi:hypothetical protein BKA65DRAFT_568710 [Rhexocercosporidium sp. MPI-PUGE-AT-0058]|nr:hypothetical protein BKA65DRAFT_568710 [Rhexocercosporidium sp. MPI-PUGE-AT-0058]
MEPETAPRDLCSVKEKKTTEGTTVCASSAYSTQADNNQDVPVIEAAILGATSCVFAIMCASVNNAYSGRDGKYRLKKVMSEAEVADMVIDYNDVTIFQNDMFGKNGQLFNLAKLGATFIPIVFALIIGATLRLVARWKAERGTKLLTLEVLVGSRSLASTLNVTILLRRPGLLNIAILGLWMLSPLAGQSSLRILETKNVTDASADIPWKVFDTTNHDMWLGGDSVMLDNADLQFRYLESMNQRPLHISDLNGTGDTDASHLAGWDSKGSLLIPETSQNTTWLVETSKFREDSLSAINGVPVVGPYLAERSVQYDLILDSNLTFPVITYLFTCGPSSKYSMNGSSWISLLYQNGIHEDKANLLLQSRGGSGFFLDTALHDQTAESGENGPQNIVFGSFHRSTVSIRQCVVRLNTRESKAQCGSRLSPIPFAYARYLNPFVCKAVEVQSPQLSDTTPLANLSSKVMKTWPKIEPSALATSSMTEIYLAYGFNYREKRRLGGDALVDLHEVEPDAFSARLTTAFNTFWFASNFNGSNIIDATSATPTILAPFTIVKCNWVYFTILVMISSLLIVCALLNAWILHHIHTPDILGYVSAMTDEKMYGAIPGPHLASTASGMERTRILGHVKLQIGDVQSGEDFGKIAITAKGSGVVRARKGRRFI